MAACFTPSTCFLEDSFIQNINMPCQYLDPREKFHPSIVHVIELVRFEAWEHFFISDL